MPSLPPVPNEASACRWTAYAAAVVVATGPERIDLMHRLCSQDLRPLQGQQASAEALFVDHQGKLVHQATVWSSGEGLYLAVAAGDGAALVAHLQRYTIVEDVHYAVVGEAVPCATLLWPHAMPEGGAGAMAPRTVCPVPSAGAAAGHADVWLPCPRGFGPGLRFIGAATPAAAQVHADRLCQAFAARWGAASPGLALGPPQPAAAWRYLRLQAGLPAFGEDYGRGAMPLELRLGGEAIAWNKGCYVGQEVLSRLDSYRKTARLLMGFRVVTAATLPAGGLDGYLVRLAGRSVGRITSWATAPAGAPLQQAVGLCVVRQQVAVAGTQVELQPEASAAAGGGTVAAALCDRPFWAA